MSDEDVVMTIDKPHFVVKVHRTLLQVDLKEGVKRELEAFVEARSALRDSLGLLFQTVVPLDVRLRDIRSVSMDKKGRVKIDIPSRKDLNIPLDDKEAKDLVDKLNELVPLEKERARRDLEEAKKAERALERERAISGKEVARGRIEK